MHGFKIVFWNLQKPFFQNYDINNDFNRIYFCFENNNQTYFAFVQIAYVSVIQTT